MQPHLADIWRLLWLAARGKEHPPTKVVCELLVMLMCCMTVKHGLPNVVQASLISEVVKHATLIDLSEMLPAQSVCKDKSGPAHTHRIVSWKAFFTLLAPGGSHNSTSGLPHIYRQVCPHQHVF